MSYLSPRSPSYEIQQAGGAALRNIRDLEAGVTKLANGTLVKVPKQVPDKSLDAYASALDELSGRADHAHKQLAKAQKLVEPMVPRDGITSVPRHLLDNWGVTALVQDARSALTNSWDLKVAPGANARSARSAVGEALTPIGQIPTRMMDEGLVSSRQLHQALDRAAHEAALYRNEAGREANQMRLIKLYGHETA